MNTTRKLLLATAALHQAPGETGDGNTEVVKRKVATHELLKADGEVTEDEKEATGIRYTLLALKDQPFEYQTGMEAGKRETMLAVFGAKTLATNETSAARNNAKGEATPQDQIQAVRDRFDLLATGEWVDRTREFGPRVDPDTLAEAICLVLVDQGKKTTAEIEAGYKATIRQKIDDDKAWAKSAAQMPDVLAHYSRLRGKAVATVEDLLV